MPRRFPLFTDACVNGSLVEALQSLAWDIVRAIDAYPEGTPDPVVFAHAAQEQRVVTSDAPVALLADSWLAEGRPFRMIFWPQEVYRSASIGSLARAFEARANQADDPFAKYPVVHLAPQN